MSHRSCLVTLLFLVLALAASGTKLLAQAPAVQVQIYDYAELRPRALHELVARTQEILVDVGVSVQVRLCRGNLALPCDSQTGGLRRLMIRLVAGGAKKMSNLRRPPLGQSFADHDGGTYASVFVERVQDAAAEANVPWLIVLAYAAVHEVGHLLLGDEAHSAQGLMKASWDRKDYEAMSQNHFHFSKEQARELASRYSAAESGEVSPSTALTDPR
jgi:hypothetical protein